ncbi:MAG TPA: hypothetical protein PKC84_15845 [Paracoccaceae bacterium]|mgnify:FL=1|nr:hypothetical protein [Paracoccaceae bacterium]
MTRIAAALTTFLLALAGVAPSAQADAACLNAPTPDCLVAMAMEQRPQPSSAEDRAPLAYDLALVRALVRTAGPEAARAFGEASPHLSDAFRLDVALAHGLAAVGRADEAVAMTAAWKAEGREVAHVLTIARHLGAGGHMNALGTLMEIWRSDRDHDLTAQYASQGLIEAGRPGAPELLLDTMASSDSPLPWVGEHVVSFVLAGQAEAALPVVRQMPPGSFKVSRLAMIALALNDPALAAEAEAEVMNIADAASRAVARRYVAASRTIAGSEGDAMRDQVFKDEDERIATVATVVAAMGTKAFTTRHMLDAMLRRIGNDEQHDAAITRALYTIDVLMPLHPFWLDLIDRMRNGAKRDEILFSFIVRFARQRPDVIPDYAGRMSDQRSRARGFFWLARALAERGDAVQVIALLAAEDVGGPAQRGEVLLALALHMP